MNAVTLPADGTAPGQPINLLKVLGPVHVWGLGVGIVLVGEFMGWNYGVGKGGAFGALSSSAARARRMSGGARSRLPHASRSETALKR